jgi:hypothetical protein
VESVVPVETVAAAMATSMAPASMAHSVAWRRWNEEERNSYEGDHYSAHC